MTVMMIQIIALLLLLTGGASAFAPQASCRPAAKSSLNLFTPDYYDSYDDENDLHIPNRLAFTTSEWRDEDDADEAVEALLESGIRFVSCAAGTEEMLGNCMSRDHESKPIIATNFNQRFQFGGEASVVSSMEASLDMLDGATDEVQVLQCRPSKLSVGGLGALADGMVSSIDEGYCVSGGAVDITNKGKLKSFCRKMEARDEFLATNVFDFNLINRKHEGMIEACKDLGVIPLCRYPLGRDLLASGKWTSEDPSGPEGESMRFSLKVLEKWEPLHSMQYRIMEKVQKRVSKGPNRELKDYRDRRFEGKKTGHTVTPAQVAINYVVAKGGVPLVDVHDAQSAEDLIGCVGWKLGQEEVDLLDQAAELSSM